MLDEIDRRAYECHPINAATNAVAIIFHSFFSFTDSRPSFLPDNSVNNEGLIPMPFAYIVSEFMKILLKG